MAIKIPSKNIYQSKYQKVRDNYIDKIEVDASNVVPNNEYNVSVFNSQPIFIDSGSLTEENTENRDIEDIVKRYTIDKTAVWISNTEILNQKLYNIAFDINKLKENKYITDIFAGKDKDGNEQIKYTVRGKIRKGKCTRTLNWEVKSSSNLEEGLNFSNISDITFVNVEEETENVIFDYTSKKEYTFKGTPNSTYFSEQEITSSVIPKNITVLYLYQNKEAYTVNGAIMVAFTSIKMGGTAMTVGQQESMEGMKISGEYEEFVPSQIEISAYGNTIGIDIKSEKIVLGSEEGKYPLKIENNELLQTTNGYLGGEDTLIEKNYKNVLEQYKNGKETIELRCSIADYYDTENKLAISKKDYALPFTFNLYDEVIPFYYTNNEVEQPFSMDENGNSKVFQVIKFGLLYDGALWQNLTLQELGESLPLVLGIIDYVIENGSYVIVNGIKEDTDTEIPEIIRVKATYSGYPVTKIADYAFFDKTEISNVTEFDLPYSISEIGVGAFMAMQNLETINIPSNLAKIPDYFVGGCPNLSTVKTTNSTFKEIGYKAFMDCQKLANVSIPDNVTDIGEQAFKNCISIDSIKIPNNLQTIKSETFRNCSSLESVTMGENLQTIEPNAFTGCASIQSVDFSKTIKNDMWAGWKAVSATGETVRFNADNIKEYGEMAYSLMEYSSYTWKKIDFIEPSDSNFSFAESSDGTYYIITAYNATENIPETVYTYPFHNDLPVSEIGNSVFSYNDWGEGTPIKNVVLHEGIARIGEYSLSNTNLENVELPNTLINIGSSAFSSCSSLSNITLPQSLQIINPRAFYASNLEEITIPKNVDFIGNECFYQCHNLKKVYFEDKKDWSYSPDNGVHNIAISEDDFDDPEITALLFQASSHWLHTILQKGAEITDLPTSDTGLEFELSSDGSYYLISGIGSYIETSNTTLFKDPEYYDHKPVKGIVAGAFSYNETLTQVLLSSRLTEIGEEAFAYSKKITTIYLQTSLSNRGTFLGCTAINGIYIHPSAIEIGAESFKNCRLHLETDVTGYMGVDTSQATRLKIIGTQAFYNSSINGFIIPNNLQTIMPYAFTGSDLATFQFTSKKNWNWRCGVTIIDKNLSNEKVAERLVRSVPDGDPENTGIDAGKIITRSSEAQGELGFEPNDTYAEVDGYHLVLGTYSATKITIPEFYEGNAITFIDNDTFKNGTALTYVNIGNNVIHIGQNAFEGCTNLGTLLLGTSIEQIRIEAFKNCKSLTSISIPASIKEIRKNAFVGCENLYSVNFDGAKATWTITEYDYYGNIVGSATTEIIGKLDADLLSKLKAGNYWFSKN